MGIDPARHDLSLKASSQRIYVLGRDEVARFGLETRNESYETPWAKLYVAEKFLLMKSVTLRTSLEPIRYSKTQFAFHCGNTGRRPFFGFHREIAREGGQVTKISLTIEDVFLPFYVKPGENSLEIGVTGEIWQDTLVKMAEAKFLTVSEKISKTGETLNEIRLSGSGLEQGLSEFQRRCIIPALTTVFPMTPLIPSDLTATKKKPACRSSSQC